MGDETPRSMDDEGLPRPPPMRGKIPKLLIRGLVATESILFLAIAVALAAIAVVVFVGVVVPLMIRS